MLGYPGTALVEAERALKAARETDHAPTLIFALTCTTFTHICCREYAAANAQLDECIALAEEKGAVFFKAMATAQRGCVLALTGKASDAVQTISAAITAYRSTGATVWITSLLSYLALAYAELGKFDDAWRCIGEAMTVDRNNQGKMVRGRDQSHRRGNRTEVARAGCCESGSVFRARARSRARAAGKVLGTARRDEHGAALARSGEAAASSRTARSGLRLVHRGLRHARSEGGEGAARRVGFIRTLMASAAHQRRGAAVGGQLRQAAGVVAAEGLRPSRSILFRP